MSSLEKEGNRWGWAVVFIGVAMPTSDEWKLHGCVVLIRAWLPVSMGLACVLCLRCVMVN